MRIVNRNMWVPLVRLKMLVQTRQKLMVNGTSFSRIQWHQAGGPHFQTDEPTIGSRPSNWIHMFDEMLYSKSSCVRGIQTLEAPKTQKIYLQTYLS